MKRIQTNIENKVVFANNLKRYLLLSGKTQKEVALAIGVTTGNFCDWMNYRSYPRVDKIQALADYFGIKMSDLIEEVSEDEGVLDDQKILDLFHQIPKEKRAEAIALCESVLNTFSKFEK